MATQEGPSIVHLGLSIDRSSTPPENAMPHIQHARKADIQMVPESAMLLSRVLEREVRKHTVLKQFRPSTIIRKPLREIPAVSTAKLLRTGTYNKVFRGLQLSKHRSAVSGREAEGPSVPIDARPSVRTRLWLLFNEPHSSSMAHGVSVLLFAAVFVSTIVYVLSTVPEFDDSTKTALSVVEGACMYMFSADFLIRLTCSPNVKAFGCDIFNWIDLVSIIPFYLEMFLEVKGSSIGAIRIMRLIRVARILKLSRYTSSIQIFIKALILSAKPLFMLLFLIIVAMIVFSSAMYFAELTDSAKFCRDPLLSKACHPTQNPPDNCCELNPFYSIAATFWWCIVSMTTVGYGDDFPVTPTGKLIATLTMMSGMLILALPISVIGSNFQHVMKEEVQHAMLKSLDTLSTMEVVQKKEMIELLKGFNILGESIDIDPDELIALYDVHKTGRLEADALAQFRRDLEALQKYNLTIASPPMTYQKEEQQKQQWPCASSIADLRRGHHDPLTKQVATMEEILEVRLLETEVRFENKLNALMKIVAQMEKKIAILRD
ncbi:hypothetical protein H310_00154 [Aphanomyces invadans]|uniref:Ion transport domain-containing protein n=1 Tax=Aphanomyces invadans TaxID=157072 RepID=A0A024UUM3_9STRA|nr:hypothetical protein H310_00154 [Aphanomyces invadans]ETW09622.1 hypothetical protein H310_00154 [Aphanomyces invadans]|eukprot:XP_008861033.1 hypothetical protein H310_00154 [Aphanomyces invadans]